VKRDKGHKGSATFGGKRKLQRPKGLFRWAHQKEKRRGFQKKKVKLNQKKRTTFTLKKKIDVISKPAISEKKGRPQEGVGNHGGENR